MPTKIAINGFGRIGRAAFKIIQARNDAEVVAINDLTNPKTLAHLLRYDTVYGKYDKEVTFGENFITVSGKKIPILSEKDPTKLPWKEYEVDVVLECTGRFEENGASLAHVEAGAKKVVVSAPTKGTPELSTYLMGVNSEDYKGEKAISNASCTTNCISPVISIINESLGVKKAGMTTIHAITATQKLVDSPDSDLRRGRAAGYNMAPTTTGAALATTKVIPELSKKFDGIAVRVPILAGSLSDITMLVSRNTTVDEVNEIFKNAVKTDKYKDVVMVTEEPIVSSDIVANTYSAIVDLPMTSVIDGDLVKVLAWYDNEWGYSNRLVEMALHIAK